MEVISVGQSQNLITKFPEHRHGYWEILYNVKGSGTMTVSGLDYPFREKDIMILPPNTPHSKFSAEGFSDMSLIVKEMRPIGSEEIITILPDDEEESVRKIFELCYHFFEKKEQLGTNRTLALINALGESIYQALVVFYQSGQQRDLRIEGFTELLDANITNPSFDLAAEIEKTGYSKGYFRKVFKEATGESPVTYFNRIRIEYAMREFHQYGPSRSIKDISLASGFQDPYYFSRVFKKVTGISPKGYLAQLGAFDPGKIDEDHLHA